jgi:hypothetical protein
MRVRDAKKVEKDATTQNGRSRNGKNRSYNGDSLLLRPSRGALNEPT